MSLKEKKKSVPTTMSLKEKKKSVPVVSVGCSRIKSYLSLRPLWSAPRPQPEAADSSPVPPPRLHFVDDAMAAQAYWKRACELECELSRLDSLINSNLSARIKNATTATTNARGAQEAELTRLHDGSYLREVKKVGRPWGRLVMQISSPAIAQNFRTATELMGEMASMGEEELRECLTQSIPMHDMAGCDPGIIFKGSVVATEHEERFPASVVVRAIDRIETLAMEGLKKQIGSSRGTTARATEQRDEDVDDGGNVVVVVIIQVRDPEEGYEAVGEPMVGVIETSGGRRDINGVYVAGRGGGKDLLWTTSATQLTAADV